MNTDVLPRWSLILGAVILFAVLIAGCTQSPSGSTPTTTQITTAPAPAETLPTTVITTMMTTSPTPQVTTTSANQTNVSPMMAITIKDFAFNPQTATVSNGTTVTWTNLDPTQHQIINAANRLFNQGEMFKSGPLEMGQSYSFTFNTTGTFLYLDTLHPALTGKIVVT